NSVKPVTVRYYARENDDWESAFDVVQYPLRSAKKMTEAPAPYGRSFFVRLRDLHSVAGQMLQDNPYALVQAKQNDKR
ncbi:MAG: hypothetical protein NTW47_01615, partial [Proteobacteria bacterium]|nr:hypothetical protein [Pseudomonadota bacterium]